MPRIDQDVVRQPRRPERRDAPAECGSEQEAIVRLALDEVPDAHEGGVRAHPSDRGLDIVCLQIDPADHPGDERMGAGELEEPLGLLDSVLGLHRDRRLDAGLFQVRHEIHGQEVALQRVHAVVDPGVLARVVAPEVLMGVDDHGAGIGMPPRSLEM